MISNPKLILNLIVMAGVTYLVRAIPLVLVRKKIENRFIRSFLYYIPYAVLSAMTFPAIFTATGNVATSLVGLFVALGMAIWGKGLLTVALSSCAAAYLADLFMRYVLPYVSNLIGK